MKRYISFIIITVIAILFAVSCRHKDLCYLHPHKTSLRIEFDWKNCPDAKPAGMYVYFYPIDSPGTPFLRDISREGAVIDVPDGDYNIICYNSDSETLRPTGTDKFDTHQAFTRLGGALEGAEGMGNTNANAFPTTSMRAEGAEEEDVVICVDELWGCIAINVSIYGGEVAYTYYPEGDNSNPVDVVNNERLIKLYPTDLVCHYSYEAKHVINATNVVNACATISGMSGHYWFADGSIANEAFTLPLSTRIQKSTDVETEASFLGEFFTFGHHESNEKAHKMMFYIWRSFGENGSANQYIEFDVTDQVDNAPNKRRVHIVIEDTIKLVQGPPDPSYSGMFDVVIDGWGEENYDIPLG